MITARRKKERRGAPKPKPDPRGETPEERPQLPKSGKKTACQGSKLGRKEYRRSKIRRGGNYVVAPKGGRGGSGAGSPDFHAGDALSVADKGVTLKKEADERLYRVHLLKIEIRGSRDGRKGSTSEQGSMGWRILFKRKGESGLSHLCGSDIQRKKEQEIRGMKGTAKISKGSETNEYCSVERGNPLS